MADQTVNFDDSDELYRRVLHYFIKSNNSISSAAFKDRRKPERKLSVDCAKLTTPMESLQRASERGVQANRAFD